MFMTLDMICLMEECYDEYCADCTKKGIEPKDQKEWYATEWMEME